jgi:hypothetical protein
MARRHAPTLLVSECFVRGLGFVYAVAFASLGGQIAGLVGEHGIEPAAELLAALRERAGGALPLQLPSWFWLTGANDWALRGACIAGAFCSVLVVAGRLPRLALLGAWSLYLSLTTVGGVFLSYQWDMLLLETGIVGLFVATPGSVVGLWLARALCLKLMLLSGIVKLTSGDPTWRNLTALSFHFWTQPLPAWPALLANACPAPLLAAMTFVSLTIELVAPLFILGPRKTRLIAAAALALLQLGIAATGSYGFFSLLSLLLCLALLDDDALLRLTPKRLVAESTVVTDAGSPAQSGTEASLSTPEASVAPTPHMRVRSAIHVSLATALVFLSICAAMNRFRSLPEPLQELMVRLAPFRSINSYGLFAVMTTDRREIAIEGSRDGITWRPYEFAWKPDHVAERPDFATPHMPRLDWQMWFAALGRCEQQRWFHELLTRILEGSSDVLSLFESNPFPEGPPRYLRTPLARYRFAPSSEWLHGKWWVSEPIGEYCPTATLRDGKLVRWQ